MSTVRQQNISALNPFESDDIDLLASRSSIPYPKSRRSFADADEDGHFDR